MRVYTVPKVVQKAGKNHILLILFFDKNWLVVSSPGFSVSSCGIFQMDHHILSNMCHSKRMGVPAVNCSREHVIKSSQLFDVPQSLKFWRVNKVPTIKSAQ